MSEHEEVSLETRGAQVRGALCVLLFYGLTMVALGLWGMVYRTAVVNSVDLRPFLVGAGVLGGLHLLSLLGPLLRRGSGRSLRARWRHERGVVLVLSGGAVGGLAIQRWLLSTWIPPML